MADAPGRVGVVVVAYASASTLESCLRSLPLDRLYGTVVVDNNSPDNSAEIAAAVDGVQVVRMSDNRGFGAGCNEGLRRLAGAELILFLNPDAVLTPGALTALVEHLDAHPRCALVGPRLFRDGEPLASAGSDAGLRTELRNVVPTALSRLFPERRLPASYDRTGPVGYVEGAAFLVRADSLRRAGGFDEEFFLFFEELDLARRLRAFGWTVELCSTARVEHARAVSRRTLADSGRAHLLRSTVLYLRRRSRAHAAVFVAVATTAWWLRSHFGGLDRDLAAAMTRAVRGQVE